ncbi:MAG TPA: YihY/virulence factor BrkB family protein [Gemmatimonadaceae bacterium]|nr:YihY/virulence factor BrkB family protein [Gemmatimonadaceae bacterium]
MPTRSLPLRVWWTLKDYAKRIWDNAGDDNITFLAGGIAFNILLAAVPFVLLLLSGLGYLLNQSATQSADTVWRFIDQLLPPHAETPDAPIHKLINDIIRARGAVGLYSLIGFVWFSTRLFGTLRTVLGDVFDIEQGRSIIAGKLFDIQITIVSTILFVAYTAVNAYVKLATTRGIHVLQRLGLQEELMGRLEYWVATLVASAFILLMFFALYKFLPNRRIRWQSAMTAAVVTSVLFEVAKALFTSYVGRFNPGTLYTGTLYALVIVVFWVYYAALIFILGGEVGRVYEMRRTRRQQRETFES